MKQIAIITILILSCLGEANAIGYKYIGQGSSITEYCIDGVAYLTRFDGMTVKYNKSGLIQTCNY